MLFDSGGTPHIAFADYASQHFPEFGADEFAGQIRHAVKTGSTWQIQRVVSQSDPLRNQMIYPTMALWSNEIVFAGIRRYDYLDADLWILRSDHFYAFATLPRTGLTVSATVLGMIEGQQTSLTVTRHNGNNSAPLTVRLSNADATELNVAVEVTIPAGQRSAATTVTALNDNMVDGQQTVSITASATGYITGQTVINVADEPFVEIHGTKFVDVDADGLRSVGEAGLAGWTIFLDLNQDGAWDAVEPETTTNGDGTYSFTDLVAGTYLVVAKPQTGWGATGPLTGFYAVTLPGGQAAHGLDFGGLPGGFDLLTGRLTLLAWGDDQLQVAANSGQVVVHRNGQVDGDLVGIPAASVTSIVVLGGTGDNQLDLQGVTSAEFPALGSVVVREPAGGIDTIDGSDGTDTFFASGPDTLRGHDGDDALCVRDLAWASLDGGPGRNTLLLDGSHMHLDLPTLQAGRLANIQVIDVTGTGPNQLTLDAFTVLELSAAPDPLFVYAGSDDQVQFVATWTFVGPTFINGRLFNRVTRDGATVNLHGPHAWQNPANRLDTNRDGFTSPIDALLVINASDAWRGWCAARSRGNRPGAGPLVRRER